MKKLLTITLVMVLALSLLTACGGNNDNGNNNGNNGGGHTHSFTTEWTHNATQHWHECECMEKADVANHTGDPCTVCGYESNDPNDPNNAPGGNTTPSGNNGGNNLGKIVDGRLVYEKFSLEYPAGWTAEVKSGDPQAESSAGSFIQLTIVGLSKPTAEETIDYLIELGKHKNPEDVTLGGYSGKVATRLGTESYYIADGNDIALITVYVQGDDAGAIETALQSFKVN